MFDIYFIGTGGGVPSKHRGLPGYLFKYMNLSILLDCGEGVQERLIKYGLGVSSIDVIGISHLHADHVLGLPGLLQTMSMLGRTKPLYIMGPKKLEDFISLVNESTNFTPNFRIIFTEEFHNENIEIRKFETCHTIESYGFLIIEKDRFKVDADRLRAEGVKDWRIIRAIKEGKEVNFEGRVLKPEDYLIKVNGIKIAYTGDTKYCEKVVREVRGVDLLLHDSTFSSEIKDAEEYGHSTSAQAAEAALNAEAKRLGLIHISSRYVSTNELLLEARRIFSKVFVAEDLSRYSL